MGHPVHYRKRQCKCAKFFPCQQNVDDICISMLIHCNKHSRDIVWCFLPKPFVSIKKIMGKYCDLGEGIKDIIQVKKRLFFWSKYGWKETS